MSLNVTEVDYMQVMPRRKTHKKDSFSSRPRLCQPVQSLAYPRKLCATSRTVFLWLLVLSFSSAHLLSLMAQTTARSSELASRLQRAQAALRLNDQVTAARQFHAVLKLDPSNAEANTNLGVMDFFHNDCRSAEEEFHNALRVAPSLAKVQVLLAICEKRLGQASAQTDLENIFAKLQDAKLRTQVGIELADLYYQQGKLEKTTSILQTLLNLNPGNIDILFFAQRVYSELADETLNELTVLAPGSARMEQLIAEKLINAGNLKDATRHYRKALQINPNLPGVHFELAEALMESSPNDAASQKEAMQELELSVKVDGVSSNIECERARINFLQNNLEESYVEYKKALEINPSSENAQMGVARLLMEQDKPQEAISYLRKVVVSDPMNAEAHYRLAMAYKDIHLFDKEKEQIHAWNVIKSSKNQVKQIYQEMDQHTQVNDRDVEPSEQ